MESTPIRLEVVSSAPFHSDKNSSVLVTSLIERKT